MQVFEVKVFFGWLCFVFVVVFKFSLWETEESFERF